MFSPWDAFTFNEVHLFLAAEMSTTRWMESSPDSFNISNQNGGLRIGKGVNEEKGVVRRRWIKRRKGTEFLKLEFRKGKEF